MIRSIQLNSSVDLDNCDNEPIHIPGSIQPHGVLLGLRTGKHIITYCSGNSADMLGKGPSELLGNPVSALFHESDYKRFENYVASWTDETVNPLEIEVGNKKILIYAHYSGDVFVVEMEEAIEIPLELIDFYNILSNFISQMQDSSKISVLSQHVAKETRRITGYDRVMVYKFDRDYNGAVIAESKRDDLEPFLGLHYPHTDIPRQARQLYLRNLMRMIGDINYTPVPIYTLSIKETEEPLDIGMAQLRSVSPIHVEYLQNMGVGATLVISLISDGRLWGLLTCHHYSAKAIPYQIRTAAKLQGHFMASQIAVRERAEEYDCEQKVNLYLKELLSLLQAENFLARLFEEEIRIVKLCNASGVAMIYEDRVHTCGRVPADKDIKTLTGWFFEHMQEDSLVTDKLIDIYPGAKDLGEYGAGLLVYSAGKLNNFMMIWFRPEMEKTVNWAGDPAKALVINTNGAQRLTPRKSFAQWKEKVRFQSLPWRDCEANAGIKLASALYNQIIWRILKKEEQRYKLLSEKLQQANEDLEKFAWMSSHDMKEPLRMISIYSQMLLSQYKEELDENGVMALNFLNEGVLRLNALTGKVLQYSKLTQSSISFEYIDLKDVLKQVVLYLEIAIEESGGKIEIDKLPEKIYADKVLIGQLFQNLIQNALKFRGTQPLLINISSQRLENEWEFSVADNGIGIDMQYKERIFNIFQRLHTHDHFEGSGIGLSICRRIVELHNGRIWVESELGKGATFKFTMQVPKSEEL